MRTFYTSLQILFFVLFGSAAWSQGCYPDPQFANDTAGVYPSGPMQMDCSGLSASKSMIFDVEINAGQQIQFPGLDSMIIYYRRARIDSVIGLPAGLELETDVINSASADSPYGEWVYTGPQFNMTAPVGCFSVVGSASDWNAASTGGPNNDGSYPLTIYVMHMIDSVYNDPIGFFTQSSGTWSNGFEALSYSVELRVNESACTGDISISAATTGDDTNTPECEGTVDIDVYYGVPPYTFSYSNGATGAAVDSLCAGLYTVNVTDANGASGSHQFAIAADSNIYVNPGNPPAWVDSLFYATSNCSLDYNLPVDSFMITDAYTIGNDTCFVEWVVYQQGSPFTLGSFYPFLGFNPTVFSFTLYCQNGRSQTGVFQLYEYLDLSAMVGIRNTSGIEGFSVFPNPSAGVFNLQMGSPALLEYEVYDLAGKQLQRQQLSGATNYPINLVDVPTGTYLLKVTSEEGVEVRKLIKE